jgi:hypothetical protein
MKNIELKQGKDGKENAISINTPQGRIVIGVREPYNSPCETNVYFVNASGTSQILTLDEWIKGEKS